MKDSLRVKLDSLAARLEDVNRLLAAEDATRDMEQFKRLSREHAEIGELVGLYERYRKAERDAAAAKELAADPEMRALAEDELKSANASMENLEADLQKALLPRDIEPEVRELEDVFLYTVDDLSGIVAANLDARRSAVEQAEAIIETQVGQFMHWMQARETVPLIRAMREHAESARQHEVERAMKMLARGDDPASVLEALSQGLANKLMHAPTQALNEAAGEERQALAASIARLFRLDR